MSFAALRALAAQLAAGLAAEGHALAQDAQKVVEKVEEMAGMGQEQQTQYDGTVLSTVSATGTADSAEVAAAQADREAQEGADGAADASQPDAAPQTPQEPEPAPITITRAQLEAAMATWERAETGGSENAKTNADYLWGLLAAAPEQPAS